MYNLKSIQYFKKIFSTLFSYFLVLLFFSPLLLILFHLFTPETQNFRHIINMLLKTQIINTFGLIICVSICVFLIVFPATALLTIFQFPGSTFLKFGLILPLAVPSYVGSYVYEKVFDYSGVINSVFRNQFGINHLLDMDLFSFHGSVFIFTLFLYPYLYTILLSFFRKYIGEIIEVSRSLGHNILQTFCKLILPLSRISIISGLLIVAMEILNDFGVTSYLGVETFSSSIFKAWFNLNDINTAAKLAAHLIPIVFIFIYTIKHINKTHIYLNPSRKITPIKLHGWKAFTASAYCYGLFFLSFVLPIVLLCYYSFFAIQRYPIWNILLTSFLSIVISSVSTLLLVGLGIFFATLSRKKNQQYIELFSLQYALPSTIIAVAVFIAVMSLEKLPFVPSGFTITLQNSFILLIFAYVMRFLILGYNMAHHAFKKIGLHYTETSKILGYSSLKTFFNIELPLMTPTLSMGAVIIFIDIFKELPLTLFLRPFNFNTPATLTHDFVINEMFTEAAPSALALISILSAVTFIIFRIGYFSDAEGDIS
ncbi:MAG: ABC transporter permease [Brevinema sp.]